MDACRQLVERLAPYRQSMKGAPFPEIVRAAHMDRCDLSAHGWYITPDITGESCDQTAHRIAPLSLVLCIVCHSSCQLSCQRPSRLLVVHPCHLSAWDDMADIIGGGLEGLS